MRDLKKRDIAHVLEAVPRLLDLPVRRMWINYDDEADVLYIRLRRPQRASGSELPDDGLIIHRRGKQVVGVTVLDASTR